MRYRSIPLEEWLEALKEASPIAQEIGQIILGVKSGEFSHPDILAAVAAYQKSLPTRKSKRPRRRRRSRNVDMPDNQ